MEFGTAGPMVSLWSMVERAMKGVGAACFGKASGADQDHVGICDQAGQINILGFEHALEGDVVVFPNRDLQRRLAAHGGELAAQQLLGSVEVRIDQTGKSDETAAVEHCPAF